MNMETSNNMFNYGSLKSLISNLYKEAYLKDIGCFEKLHIKIQKWDVDLAFLKWCGDDGILPSFTHLHYHKKRVDLEKILDKVSRAILYVEIRFSRYDLNYLSSKKFPLAY